MIGFVVLKIEKGILALLMGVGPDLILDLTVFLFLFVLIIELKELIVFIHLILIRYLLVQLQ